MSEKRYEVDKTYWKRHRRGKLYPINSEPFLSSKKQVVIPNISDGATITYFIIFKRKGKGECVMMVSGMRYTAFVPAQAGVYEVINMDYDILEKGGVLAGFRFLRSEGFNISLSGIDPPVILINPSIASLDKEDALEIVYSALLGEKGASHVHKNTNGQKRIRER